MQKRNEIEWVREAPSPIIPMYRPASQSSKRANYTISPLSPKYQKYVPIADDIQPPAAPKPRTSNENVTEIVQFLQTHVFSHDQSQSTGPKSMIKAGQRRLRLALRNRKGTDSKAKAEDTSCQVETLHNNNSFPISQYRNWGHKRNSASTASSSKSVPDLSFKSNSRRDVETIGQPWLESPLETRDEPGSKASSQLSSLDLRDLASFVEAAVNFSQFEDSVPPPYQPPTERHTKPATVGTLAAQHVPQLDTPVRSAATNSNSNAENRRRKAGKESPTAPRFSHPTQPRASGNKGNVRILLICLIYDLEYADLKQFDIQPLELKPKSASPVTTKPPPSNSATSSKSSPTLKLFPDAIVPRSSSRTTLRVPTGRSPTPNRCFSPTPDSQDTPALATFFRSSSSECRSSTNSLPRIQEDTPETRKSTKPSSREPERPLAGGTESIKPENTQSKPSRRHSSLLPSLVNVFPIPAPSRPLPSVPEPNPRLHDVNDQKVSLGRQPAQTNTRHLTPDIPNSMSSGLNKSSENSKGPTRGRDSPFPMLVTEFEDPATTNTVAAGPPIPVQPRHGSLGKAESSRAAKVRSVIMKDLRANRHEKSSSKGKIVEEAPSQVHGRGQISPTHSDNSQMGTQPQYQRKISSGPSSPPPKSPPPNSPPRYAFQNRRYCTSPASTITAALEALEGVPGPTSGRDHGVCQQNDNLRSVETKRRRELTDPNVPETLEIPLPSSDDEGPDGEHYWYPSRKPSGKRRRGKQTPIIIGEPASERGRSLKKRQATGNARRQQDYGRCEPENSLGKHRSPKDCQPYESCRRQEQEPKANFSLEGRIEHLERQNKILQAALLAALDVGVKQDLSSLLATSTASTTAPPLTGRSSSSMMSTSISEVPSMEHIKHTRDKKVPYRPESWIASPDSFTTSSYDGDCSAQTRDLEEMIDEFDLNWVADPSNMMN